MFDMQRARQELEEMISGLYAGERKLLVFGEGRVNARVMLIGEAPGEKESLAGRPFVGKAGQNLNAFLEVSGLTREDMYVTNVVKFRPTKISAAGRASNRPPTREEIRLFLPFLKKEIETVAPKWVVTLGNVPLQALLGQKETVGEAHGMARAWEGRMLYPMYHPASVIYNPGLKEIYQGDMLRFAELIRHDGV